MSSKNKLLVEHQVFVIDALALGHTPLEVAEMLQRDYDIKVSRQNIEKNYLKARAEAVEERRAEMLKDIENHFPIAAKLRRVKEYQRLFGEAERIGDMDIESYLRRFENAEDKERAKILLEMAESMYDKPAEQIGLQLAILKQVREEVAPLRVKVDLNKGATPAEQQEIRKSLKNVPDKELNKIMELIGAFDNVGNP